jgi:hypothetical protein
MSEDIGKLLTRAELEEITGFVQPKKQCECLRENGIFFIERKDGRPSTTWAHVEHPFLPAISFRTCLKINLTTGLFNVTSTQEPSRLLDATTGS